MTTGSSTIRPATGSTIKRPPSEVEGPDLQQQIESEWRATGSADLVAVLRRRPKILSDKSLLLNLAVREFQARCRQTEIDDLEQHCQRFREFGGSIEHSIFRQLDVHRFVDDCISLSDLIDEPKWPNVGDRFGNFHVVDELGFGSIARAYLCLQSDLGNRQVAVKASPHASGEGSVLGKLNHPNITPIYSTGWVEDSGLHFICMPYCGRSTLTDLLDVAFENGRPVGEHIQVAAERWNGSTSRVSRRAWYRRVLHFAGRTYSDAVLDLAIPIASALEHAHSHRILHGDLKPSNVLLDSDGGPLLLDFNLSQDFASSLRRCGGTLPYMPPEHLRLVVESDFEDIDAKFHPASDIFSFGALIYELLYGTTPLRMPKGGFHAKQIAADFIEQYRIGVQLPERRKSAIDYRIKSLIQRCLAFDRDQRPVSMSQVMEELRKERRWTATISRRAKAQPIAFSVVAALGFGAIVSAASYAALQPPRHERAFAAGVVAAASGELSEAISNFDRALVVDPSFDAARFARGRAYLHLNNLDFAMKDFSQLAKTGDARAMAMLAYCFNLQDVKVAAVPWYEKAIENGAASVANYNNLGACYLVAQTHLSQKEQLHLAEKYLQLALAGDPSSVTVQLNNVRLAAIKADVDSNYDPSKVWQQAFAIMNVEPQDHVTRAHIAAWYGALVRYTDRAGSTHELQRSLNVDRVAWEAFTALYNAQEAAPQVLPAKTQLGSRGVLPTLEHRYFLEPYALGFGH